MEAYIRLFGEKQLQSVINSIKADIQDLYKAEWQLYFDFLHTSLIDFVENWTKEQQAAASSLDPQQPYAAIAGTIFAIAYPDNISAPGEHTFKTLGQALEKNYPNIKGLHILPEREMSHEDLWPQDLLSRPVFASKTASQETSNSLPEAYHTPEKLIAALQQRGLLDECLRPTAKIEEIDSENEGEKNQKTLPLPEGLHELLLDRYNAHFNDGGFSQKTRRRVDPRFGTLEDLVDLSRNYHVMLDFVVNHLDIDNDRLKAFCRGEDSGRAFLLITPEEYRALQNEGKIEQTFRPRPFPLFTGLRKNPPAELSSMDEQAREINFRLTTGHENREKMAPEKEQKEKTGQEIAQKGALSPFGPGQEIAQKGALSPFGPCGPSPIRSTFKPLKPLDKEVIAFISIYFKVENDQGLNASDKRTFHRFLDYLQATGYKQENFFDPSPLHHGQHILKEKYSHDLPAFLKALKLPQPEQYAELLQKWDAEIFGEPFFAYTTFSESQVDVNPATFEGFSMVIEDLFHMLRSGPVRMLRMDAIKYLWKEIGKRNFDMEEGNRLIRVIRNTLKIAAPWVLPLDEVNSPDPVVYRMGAEGGFYYLFGPVNTTVTAFNTPSTAPLEQFYRLYREQCPSDLVPFVMLSTHDGRSVQGLGVQLPEGNVSISDFYRLKETVIKQGGQPKYRSVAPWRIPTETFSKICTEAAWSEQQLAAHLFHAEQDGGDRVVKDEYKNPEKFKAALCNALQSLLRTAKKNVFHSTAETSASGTGAGGDSVNLQTPESSEMDSPVESADILKAPAGHFLLEWVTEGRTPYELCCTTRSALKQTGPAGRPLSTADEARRLALAQLYVLTLGQGVPAIYFNDLLGLENDSAGFQCTGQPRDLNRKKSDISVITNWKDDPFQTEYHPRLQKILELREQEKAFYPGSPDFEFKALNGTVFLNHPFHKGRHAIIIGNMGGPSGALTLNVDELAGGPIVGPATGHENNPQPPVRAKTFRDLKSGRTFTVDTTETGNTITFELEAYDYLWLVPIV